MDIVNISMAVVSIILGIVSIVISIKSKSDADKINQETAKSLLEIKNLSDNVNKTSDRIESNIKTQIDRIINSNAPTQDEKMQQQLIGTLLPEIIKSPEMLQKLIEIGDKNKGRKKWVIKIKYMYQWMQTMI